MPKTSGSSDEPSSLASREGGLVWVLEDSALEAEITRRALSPENRIELFSDGSVLIERIANGTLPDAVVLDWQLPGMSGFEVCRFLRSQYDAMTLPILMLTGIGRKQDMVDALDAAANDYVTKPFDVAELQARVATLVRTSRLQKAQQRRARQLALAAAMGAALTRAGSFGDIASSAVTALLAHSDVYSVQLYTLKAGKLILGASRGDQPSVSEATLKAAIHGRAPLHVSAEAGAGSNTWLFPLFVVDEAMGLLSLSSPSLLGDDDVRSLVTVSDLLSLGIARLRAQEDREASLERERAARNEAERANDSKDEFLAMVSHELRTPLNSIAGWTSLLLNGSVEPARVTRALQTIERNARTQAQLIEDLLDITRVMSDKLVLEKVAVDLPAVIELARESARPTASTGEIRVEVIIGPDVGDVYGDPRRLQQIIWNLLTNAVKFSPSGGVVTVEVNKLDDAVEIVVRDEGQGIAPDFLPFVFERFRQADSSSVRSKGGLGLGLAIVKHLAALHGGTVEASSAGIGKGASFRVILPTGEATAQSTPIPSVTSRRAPSLTLEGIVLLIVEDDEDSRLLLTTVLRRTGAVVHAASNASDAFDLLQVHLPRVLISDVAMPGEDGITFIRRVRSLPADRGGTTPAIALSAFARPADRQRALDAGFQNYVTKPVQPAQLIEALEDLLSHD